MKQKHCRTCGARLADKSRRVTCPAGSDWCASPKVADPTRPRTWQTSDLRWAKVGYLKEKWRLASRAQVINRLVDQAKETDK